MTALGLAVALAVSFSLLTVGAAKIRAGTFASDLANYQLLPAWLVLPVAGVLPWIETATGVAIIVFPRPELPLLLAAALLSGFTAAVVFNLLRGRRIPCGCRGTTRPITWGLATTNAAAIGAIAATAAATPPVAETLLLGHPALLQGDALAVVLVLLVSAAALRLAQSLTELRPPLRRLNRMLATGATRT